MAKHLARPVPKPTHEEIAERARAIYEQNGCIPGRDVANWLEAEAQLLAARKAAAEAKPAMRARAKL